MISNMQKLFTTYWPSVRSVLVKYQTNISWEQTKLAKSVSSLLIYSLICQNIIDRCKNSVMKCNKQNNSVIISNKISSLTSFYVLVSFPFQIVHNTFSLDELLKFLIFTWDKQGFFKFLSPEQAIREIPNHLWTNQIIWFPSSDNALPQPYNYKNVYFNKFASSC